MPRSRIVLASFFLAACATGGGTETDAGRDAAGTDANVDVDASIDGSRSNEDSGTGADAGGDAGSTCDESPCRLVAPQCGCAQDEQCTINDAIVVECAPDGTAGEGESCRGVACEAGLVCGESPSFDVCLRFCNTDADCIAGPGSRCLIEFSSEIHACTVGCDPVLDTGCPSGAGCTILLESAGSSSAFTNCRPSGALTTGSACSSEEQCEGGHLCVVPAAGEPRQCVPFCRTHDDCPLSQLCNPLNRQVGTTSYGYCF